MAPRSETARLRPALAIALALLLAAGCGSEDAGEADADAPGRDATSRTPDAAGSGAVCGGFSGASCDEGLYCDYDDNLCGGQDGEGTCREQPTGCSGIYRPACGCDGEVYSNPCAARASGVDLSDDGGCEPPEEGLFPCGHLFCDAETQYCQRTTSDVAGTPDDYQCKALPEACGREPSCDCLADEPCGQDCAEDAGTFTLTCPGG